MVGQYKNGRGYTRNFAYRIRDTVATSLMDDGRVIELNPAPRDTVNDRMTIQMKDPGIEVVRHINGLFETVSDEISSLIVQGGSL
jgi:hypothetical protein